MIHLDNVSARHGRILLLLDASLAMISFSRGGLVLEVGYRFRF